MRNFAYLPLLIAIASLSGCYQFDTPPFNRSDMVPIKDSTLAQEIIAARENLPNSKQAREVGESLGSIDMVYEISPSLVVGQENKNGGTQLLVMMKNDHHVLVCTLMGDDQKEGAPGVQILDGKGPFEPKKVGGDATAVRKWAEDYIINGAKLCLAVPVADARNVKPEASSWFSKLF